MAKTKILLVEDDKSLREIYGVRLYSEGYDIISAGDGEEALAMAIKERPMLIISDVMMPKISGFDMLDILRSTTETKGTKVIMMTALSSEDQRARGEALGADRYLVKSQVGIEDVVRTVHEVLGDAPVSIPGTPVAPAAAPAMPAAPVAPAAPAPMAQPVPSAFATPPAPAAPAPSGLPQPTAPFSTNRPASLGDRVIHPLESNQPTQDFSQMMAAELGSTPPAPEAPAAPVAGPSPAPMGFQPPVTGAVDYPNSTLPPQAPAAPAAGMSFEETPYAPSPAAPENPGPQTPPSDSEPPLMVPPRQ